MSVALIEGQGGPEDGRRVPLVPLGRVVLGVGASYVAMSGKVPGVGTVGLWVRALAGMAALGSFLWKG